MSKRKNNFLDKLVNAIDNKLYDKGIGDEVTIDWDYGDYTVSLEHDSYGYIGEFNVASFYNSFKESDEDKAKKFIRKNAIVQAFVNRLATTSIHFIEEHEECDEDNYEEDDYDEYDEDEFDTEEDDVDEEEDYDDEEFECIPGCGTCCEECHCPSEDTEERPISQEPPAVTTPLSDAVTCPNCGSIHILKDGKKRGVQRYKCKDCGRYFSETTRVTV